MTTKIGVDVFDPGETESHYFLSRLVGTRLDRCGLGGCTT